MVPQPLERSEIRFRSGVISSELYAPIAIYQLLAPKTLVGVPSPIWVRRWKLQFPRYRLVNVS